jgi:hypothetical protein
MKYVVHMLVMELFGYPALVVGYVWNEIVSGFSVGMRLCDEHEAAAIDKFVDGKGRT